MRNLYAPFLWLLIGFVSCHGPHNRRANRLMSPDSLKTVTFLIDPNRDTVLKTPGGAILTIPRGAFDPGGGTVNLEVKEAYSIEAMLRGGLLTRNNGNLLSSGGMIYINVAGGGNAALRKPIAVSIPNRQGQEGMQLYRGETDDNGDVGWTNPAPLDTAGKSQWIRNGGILFQTNCAPCHSLTKTLIGPPLGWINARRPYEWLAKFTRDNLKMVRDDSYSCWIFDRYNKTPMPLFPALNDSGMRQLYDYITDASQKFDSAAIPDEEKHFDSCLNYLRKYYRLWNRQHQLMTSNSRDAAMDPDSLAEEDLKKAMDLRGYNLRWHPELFPDSGRARIAPADTTATAGAGYPQPKPVTYYHFTIENLGWYNVDRLLKGLPGVVESDLRVRVTGPYSQPVSVYLVIPTMRVIVDGRPTPNGDYVFLSEDGKLPLPRGATAYILVLGKVGEQVTLGKFRWRIEASQVPAITPQLTTQSSFDKAIAGFHFDAPDTTAATAMLFLPPELPRDTTQLREYKMLDSAIKRLQKERPNLCDCHCVLVGETAAYLCNDK